jgi:predicted enzyme related to lactoylglutathione lyase
VKRTWTIIGVSDVPSSFTWYQSLFGQPETRPGHAYFGQVLDSDGTVLLCLHQWGAHEHPSLMSRDNGTPGNGLLLFFRVDDFDLALGRARALVARLEEEPHANANTRTQEFSLRDPDGYYVTVSALSSLELRGHEAYVSDETRSGAVLYAKDMDRVAAFYEAVVRLKPADRDEKHVVLESSGCQLVVLRIPREIASRIEIAAPPVRRSEAAVKLVFVVPSISTARESAASCGGALNPADEEWSFNGFTVCDGLDPEGNVIQFRQQAG